MSAFVVAEIGASHCCEFDTAKKLIKHASEAGADAVKLQTFDPIEMAAPGSVAPEGNPWAGHDLINLYMQVCIPWSWHEDLFYYAKKLGIECFSTPFSVKATDWLEKSFAPERYKVASFEITHYPLLDRIALTGKPVMISTGCANDNDIIRAVGRFPENHPVTLMHCVSDYPADCSDVHLPQMIQRGMDHACPYGLSDHTRSLSLPAVATALGATVIEKHISTMQGGADDKFALTPDEFKMMVTGVREAEAALQPGMVKIDGMKMRRSLYAAKDLEEGHILTDDDFAILRPALGAHPAFMDVMRGLSMRHAVNKGSPITLEMFSK